MNDLAIPVEGISALHATLELNGTELTFTNLSELGETSMLRGDRRTSVANRQLVLPGDVLMLGTAVRLVLLTVQDTHQEARGALRLPLGAAVPQTDVAPDLATLLLPLSLEQLREPNLAVLLAQLPAVLARSFGKPPERIQVLQLSDGTEPERLFELDGEGELCPAAETLDTGSNRRSTVVEMAREGGLVHYPIATGHFVLLSPHRGCRRGGVVLALRFGALPALEGTAEERRAHLERWARDATLLTPILAHVARHGRMQRTTHQVEAENRYFRDRQRRHYLFKELVTESDAMRTIYARLNEFVQTEAPVLLLGEAGTGKELITRALHHLGSRKAGLLVAQNCAELDENLLDIELFGGSGEPFGDRLGIFELADGGTVYLDEIGRLPMRLQSKVLRVVKEGEVRRHGEELARAVNVRLIASSHVDLGELVAAGVFRKDLHVALTEAVLRVPALRERHEDILPLLHIFLDVFARRYDSPRLTLADDVAPAIARYDWPGNVRELQSAVESAVLKAVVNRPLTAADFGLG